MTVPKDTSLHATVQVPFNDLSRREPDDLFAIKSAINSVVDRGIFVLGPEVQAFEEEFAQYVGASHCVGVASGSDALEIALRSIGCGPNDEVVTAANAGGYAAIATQNIGSKPIFADVDPKYLTLTAESVQRALSDRTKAVIVTHLFG